MNFDHNLYIHVPFCISKCNYCAFYSTACANPDWKKYCENICDELVFWAKKMGKFKIPTIFFGGGTPSLMPIYVFERIMACINDNFIIASDCEITLESNPGTLDALKLKDFISNGVNRLSVGVQSFDDEELLFLGRKHNSAKAIDLLNVSMNTGIRVSGDFIYGLPNHTVNSVKKLCENINQIGLQHVSLYELTIEKSTPFGHMNLCMPDNNAMADMYMAIPECLNLPRYEVSNYAQPNQECRHNQNIWHGDAYIGIGRGAAGRVFLNGIWYDQMGNNERFEKISDETRAMEKIITGLRTVKGVLLTEDVKKQINMNWVNSHKDLVVCSDNYLYTTMRGMLILDEIILDVIK